jgi:protein-S-isoprenylcysteine O-methyltransferase Ste14
MIQLVVFAVGSAGIILLSRDSLRDPGAHGFYRFFAFETILALFVLNVEHWFQEPFSAFQIISWLLLLASLFLVVHGFYLLSVVGRPRDKIENTTTLVQVGAYKYIRHPLYASLLLLGWGIFFKNPSWLGGALVVAASLSLWATARVEETENLVRFGASYAAYIKTTKRFIPFLF